LEKIGGANSVANFGVAVSTLRRSTTLAPSAGFYPKTHRVQAGFERRVLQYVVLDSAPFSTVEGYGFKRLIKFLDERVKIPSARTLGRYLQEEYVKVGFVPHKIVCDYMV
jgi:Hermes transposase DNA-binding domain